LLLLRGKVRKQNIAPPFALKKAMQRFPLRP
jgi:hypothetical protein